VTRGAQMQIVRPKDSYKYKKLSAEFSINSNVSDSPVDDDNSWELVSSPASPLNSISPQSSGESSTSTVFPLSFTSSEQTSNVPSVDLELTDARRWSNLKSPPVFSSSLYPAFESSSSQLPSSVSSPLPSLDTKYLQQQQQQQQQHPPQVVPEEDVIYNSAAPNLYSTDSSNLYSSSTDLYSKDSDYDKVMYQDG